MICIKKCTLIYNPNSGKKKVKKYIPEIKEILKKYNYETEIISTKYKKHAIEIMKKQVGDLVLNSEGIAESGLIIRHLVLPNNLDNSKKVLKWIKENIDEKVYVSIMTQYFPTYKAQEYQEINRKINKEEYVEIENYIYDLGIENGYMQDFSEENEEQYVPKWEY